MHNGVTAIVDLSAIAANYLSLQALARGAETAAAVKANAYGLGVVEVSSTLYAAGCRSFYVAHYEEALELRPHLPSNASVFAMHGIPAGAEAESLLLNITAVINEPGALERMRDCASQCDVKIPVVLHVDTGMNRLGFSAAEWDHIRQDSKLVEGLSVGTVMSHLACSDEPEHRLNALQLQRFMAAAKAFPYAKKSLANSCGIFLGKDYHFDQVRPGRGLSGTNLPPGLKNPLKQALRLVAPILQLRCVDSDTSVGYGAVHHVKKGTRLATLSAGYADGLPRAFGNTDAKQTSVFYIASTPVPLIGRVSMDLIVVDVSAVPENLLRVGMEIEIVGEGQSIDHLALEAGTIGYEVMTHLLPRVERRYIPAIHS